MGRKLRMRFAGVVAGVGLCGFAGWEVRPRSWRGARGSAGGRGLGGIAGGGWGVWKGGVLVMRGRLGEGGWRSWWAIDYKGDA